MTPARNVTPQKGRRNWRPAYLAARAKGGGVGDSAQAAGISRMTVQRERVKSEKFRDAEEAAIAEANGKVRAAVFESAIGGNMTAAIFWLLNRDPTEWADRRNAATIVNVTQDGRTESEVDQRIRELVAKLEARGEAATRN